MTQRRRLDAYLAERAAEAGAEFRDGVRTTDLALADDGVTARVGGTPVAARALVGADGANGTTARTLGLAGDFTYGVALEGNIAYGPAPEERFRGRLVVELAATPGGYAWVFPKADHVNVGVGAWAWEGPALRGHLRTLLEAYGLEDAPLTDVRGHRLPLRAPGSRLARGRALLVGDAAGLVDPLTGDGMYEAFVSAKLASAAVVELLEGRAGSLEGYDAELTRALGGLTAAGWKAKIAFDRFPRTAFTLTRAPLVGGVVEKLVRGDLSRPGEARGPVRAPLRLLEALARGRRHGGEEFQTA
jgi:flavin-dependent dehydrogenase